MIKKTIKDQILENEVEYKPTPPDWIPPLPDEALYGIAGEFVKLVEPQVECSRENLLLHFYVFASAVIGRKPHKNQGGRHGVNNFYLLVGRSARARKGTGFSIVKDTFSHIFPQFFNSDPRKIASGLITSEGLIHRLRDEKYELDRSTGELLLDDDEHPIIEQFGVSDKRLIDVESEYAAILKRMSTHGNTLEEILEALWDSGTAENMSKGSAERCTNAHLNIVGHITINDLLKYQDTVGLFNGWMNRHLIVLTKRHQKISVPTFLLPDTDLQNRIYEKVTKAQQIGEVSFSQDGRKLWDEVYEKVSVDGEGLIDNILARAEPHIIRTALINMALDNKSQIEPEHIGPATAFWDYCVNSVNHIWGNTSNTGDPHSDKILSYIKTHKETEMTGFYKLLNNHANKDDINRAINRLKKSQLIEEEQQTGPSRPKRIFRLK